MLKGDQSPPADSESRPPGLPETIKKKTYTDISRFNSMAPGLLVYLVYLSLGWNQHRYRDDSREAEAADDDWQDESDEEDE